MASAFSLRLAFGMIGCLIVLNPAIVPPRFYRVQFLTVLGLLVVAAAFLPHPAPVLLWISLGAALVLAFLASIVWHLHEAPGGRTVSALTGLALLASLLQAGWLLHADGSPWLALDDLASAAVVGSAMTAMLMGHSYLISPTMSISPLMRLLGLLFASLLFRIGLAGWGLWHWTPILDTQNSFWLLVRWGLGFLAPLCLGWMAWETARIRSTQSATGILYVVVIVCFLGELASQQLLEITRTIL